MPSLMPNGKQQFFDASGKPLVNGKVFTYAAGTNNPKATFNDAAGAVANPNPLVLDARGEVLVFWSGVYKIVVQDAAGNAVYTVDNYQAPVTATDLGADAGTDLISGTWFGGVKAKLSALAGYLGASLIGFVQAGAGAIVRTIQDKLRERVSLDDFLSTPGVITQAEYDKAAARAQALNGILEVLGTYSTASLNMAKSGLIVRCGSKTTITHTGVGQALILDAGTVGSGIFGFELRGRPLVIGHAGTTDGCFIGALHHSKIKVRVKDCVTAFRVHFGVCSKYHLTCSVNEDGPFNITPSAGLVTDQRGAGEAVQDCEFYVIMEGINGTGVELNNTNGCEIRGTSEANATGITHTATCARNRFVGFDLESNTVRDLQDYSENASYVDCFALSTGSDANAQMVTSRGAKFTGGFWRTVNCQSTSSDTLFLGVATSDNASLGLTGSGTYKTINCVKQGVTGATTARLSDTLGQSGTWTPGFATSGGGAQGAATSAVGTYFLIGKLCYVQGFMSIAKGTLAAGAVSVTGLPFASRGTANDYQYVQVSEWSSVALGAGYNSLALRIAPGSLVGTLIEAGTSVPSATVDISAFPDPMGIRFSGVYEIA